VLLFMSRWFAERGSGSDRCEGAVEVQLHTGLHGQEGWDADAEYRRVHAVHADSINPLCGEARFPLLPTFARWTTAIQSGVQPCERCVALLTPRRSLPRPHLGRQLLLDGSTPQWTFTPSAVGVWCLIVLSGSFSGLMMLGAVTDLLARRLVAAGGYLILALPLALWTLAGLRVRCSVGQDGLTVVTGFRSRSLTWNEIERFGYKSGEGGARVTLIPVGRRAQSFPMPSKMNMGEAKRRAAALTELLGVSERSTMEGGASEQPPAGGLPWRRNSADRRSVRNLGRDPDRT
jgi:hypothetical protein